MSRRKTLTSEKLRSVVETVNGAGKALSGMIRRIAKEVECKAVGTPEDVAGVTA